MKPMYPDKVESVMRQYREGKEKIQKEPNKQKKLSMVARLLDGFTYEELQIIVINIDIDHMV